MNEIYNMFSVNKKKILVTGAANGNGEAIARGLGIAGAELFLIDVDEDNLKDVVDEIEKVTKSTVKNKVVDLSNADNLNTFLKKS